MRQPPIGQRIRGLRKQRRLTLEQLADLVGCHHTAISYWEREQTVPDLKWIAPLCKALECSANYLLGISKYEGGLDPDSFIVDDDALQDLRTAESWQSVAEAHGLAPKEPLLWAMKVPKTMRVVGFKEYQKLCDEVAKDLRRLKEPRNEGDRSTSGG